MTDAEKELRRLAEVARPWEGSSSRVRRIQARDNNAYEDRFTDAATPSAVLALLDRIEALEKEHGEDQGVIAVWRRRATEAERKGAEEMREEAAKLAASMPERTGITKAAYRACAMDTEIFIRDTLLLPGDAP